MAEKRPRQLSWLYFRQNYQLVIFIICIIFGINIALWVQRAYYFRDFSTLDGSRPNPSYMLSRANGRSLLYLSTLILLLVLRHSITLLRSLGLASILPLDNNIYLHKMVGSLIFFHAWFHTIMHLVNFGINVQPDPVKFVLLNSHYWDPMELGYNPPDGCELRNFTQCPDLKQSVPEDHPSLNNLTMCQVCPEDGRGPWNYGEWLFTWDAIQ